MAKQKIESLSDFAGSLLSRIEITKGAHYEAVKRYNEKSNISLVSISVLSIYVISLSFYSILFINVKTDGGAASINFFNYFALAISSFILFQNAFEAGKKYDLKAAKLHNSGRELSALYNELQMYVAKVGLAQVQHEQLESFLDRYSQILQKNSEDHENVDFFYYRYRRRPNAPVRLTFHDEKFVTDHGLPETWSTAIRQIVEEKIEAAYLAAKRKFREDQKQHVMARFNRWVNVYFSFVWFVIVPPIVMPVLYFMYLNQGLVLQFAREKMANAEQIYLVFSILFFLCAACVQAVRGMLEDRDPRYWVNFAVTVGTVFGGLYIAAVKNWLPYLMVAIVTVSGIFLLFPLLSRMRKRRKREARVNGASGHGES